MAAAGYAEPGDVAEPAAAPVVAEAAAATEASVVEPGEAAELGADPSGEAVEPGPADAAEQGLFAWFSLDPVTDDLVRYEEKECLLLEAAFKAGDPEVTIMVKPTTLDHGLVATVIFNHPNAGEHIQRTMSGTGERPVRRTATSTVELSELI